MSDYSPSKWRDKIRAPLVILLPLIRRRNARELIGKAYSLWKRAGFRGVWRRLTFFNLSSTSYSNWVKQYDTLTENDQRAIVSHIAQLQYRPRISILMPTYNTPERWLRQAIESVRNQLYTHWELCVADDASPDARVRTLLDEYQRLDARIKIVFRPRNGHISAASNSALAIASGDFSALLDHDDELPKHALYMVVVALNDNPNLNLLYSDEDKITENGRRFDPTFKPEWNPDLCTAQNMVSHFGVYRTEILRAIGGFHEGVEGSQDWDLALRVAEAVPAASIKRIPHILYHWRAIAGSTAIGHGEKNYVIQASQQLVREHLHRTGRSATVEPAFSSYVRVRDPAPDPPPLISLILLGGALHSEALIQRTRHPNVEVIVCGRRQSIQRPPIRETDGENVAPAKRANLAAKEAKGEILCIMNNDFLPMEADWLEELAGQALRPEIGAVGPKLLDANGKILSALTVLYDQSKTNRVAWRFYQGLPADERGLIGRAALPQNLTILHPACYVLRTSTFHAMEGFDAEYFPNGLFALDLNLRLIQAGYRNLWTPYACLIAAARGAIDQSLTGSSEEAHRFRTRWKEAMRDDPAHNPNLAYDSTWPLLAFPPRTQKPWRKQREGYNER
ncbi:MAG TPA: glycosyl transferase family 2 [Betaproteobacteria bacterium]|nr:glycosyl transferase family 2 [Betaproteobacteria bacterium]